MGTSFSWRPKFISEFILCEGGWIRRKKCDDYLPSKDHFPDFLLLEIAGFLWLLLWNLFYFQPPLFFPAACPSHPCRSFVAFTSRMELFSWPWRQRPRCWRDGGGIESVSVEAGGDGRVILASLTDIGMIDGDDERDGLHPHACLSTLLQTIEDQPPVSGDINLPWLVDTILFVDGAIDSRAGWSCRTSFCLASRHEIFSVSLIIGGMLSRSGGISVSKSTSHAPRLSTDWILTKYSLVFSKSSELAMISRGSLTDPNSPSGTMSGKWLCLGESDSGGG